MNKRKPLPYASRADLLAAHREGVKFVLHYYDTSHAVTSMGPSPASNEWVNVVCGMQPTQQVRFDGISPNKNIYMERQDGVGQAAHVAMAQRIAAGQIDGPAAAQRLTCGFEPRTTAGGVMLRAAVALGDNGAPAADRRIATFLAVAASCGIAHNNGAGGEFILVANEAQLHRFFDKMGGNPL